VDAAVARRLGPADVADLVQYLSHAAGDPLRVAEVGAGLRVDVDPQLVRVVDVRPPRGPRVEVDRPEVRGPRDLRELGHAELVRVAARRERDARDLDPLRPALGDALLVDRLALGPVRVALELRRPLVEGADDPLADREVVANVIELRLPARGVEDLVRVRHLDDPLPDLQLDELAHRRQW
jgi:hypothetical protein